MSRRLFALVFWLRVHAAVSHDILLYRTVSYHTPRGRIFPWSYISTVGTMAVPKKRWASETSRRELSRGRVVCCWHPLGCRAIERGKLPQGGCGIHRPSYSVVACLGVMRQERGCSSIPYTGTVSTGHLMRNRKATVQQWLVQAGFSCFENRCVPHYLRYDDSWSL